MYDLRHAHTFIHLDVRTISGVVDVPEGNRIVTREGKYATSRTTPTYGITTHDKSGIATVLSGGAAPEAWVNTRAYSAPERVTLTATQAADVGGQAGIYQVITEIPSGATAPAAGTVFFIGESLNYDSRLSSGSSTQLIPGKLTYRNDVAVCLAGMAVCEAAGPIERGAPVTSDSQGRAVVATSGDYVIGVAEDSTSTATPSGGEFIRVTLRPSQS